MCVELWNNGAETPSGLKVTTEISGGQKYSICSGYIQRRCCVYWEQRISGANEMECGGVVKSDGRELT